MVSVPIQRSVWLSSTSGHGRKPLNSTEHFANRDFLRTADTERILPRPNPALFQWLVAPMLDFPTVVAVVATDDQHPVLAGWIDDLA